MIELWVDGMDITGAVELPVQLEDDIETGPVKCAFVVYEEGYSIATGMPVKLKVNGIEWFAGFIVDYKRDKNKKVNFIAYDPIVILVKSKNDLSWRKRTPTQIIENLCSWYGIKLVETPSIPVVLDIFRPEDNKSIYEMMVMALLEGKKKTNKKYWIRYEKGLRVFEKTPSSKITVFEMGIEETEYNESIEDTRTQIRVINREKRINVVSKDQDAIKKYGLMTELEEFSGKTKAEAKAYADRKIKELAQPRKSMSFSHVHGIQEKRFWCGDYVYVADPSNNVVGGYYMKKVSYEIFENHVKLSADVNHTVDLPNIEYKDREEEVS